MAAGPAAKLIRAESFLDWLERAGVIPNRTRRVVIEATTGDMVHIYAEQYGATDLIAVEPPAALRGAQVRVLEGHGEAPDAQ